MISRRSRFHVKPNVRKAAPDIHILVEPSAKQSASSADAAQPSSSSSVPPPQVSSPAPVAAAPAAATPVAAQPSCSSPYASAAACTSSSSRTPAPTPYVVTASASTPVLTTHRVPSPTPSEAHSVASSRDMRKRFTGYEELDRNTFTMSDLIYWNPRNDTQLKPPPDLKHDIKTDGKGPANQPKPVDQKSDVKRESLADSKEGVKRELLSSTTGNIKADADTKAAIRDMKCDTDGKLMPAPQVKIGEDGELIVDEESLTVKRDVIGSAAGLPVITEHAGHYAGRRITSHSFRRKVSSKKKWTVDETESFYAVLSSTGPDFGLMQNFFTHRTRLEIKNKYRREERNNRARIEAALDSPRPLDESLYAFKYDAKRYDDDVRLMREERARRQKRKLAQLNGADGQSDSLSDTESDSEHSVITLASRASTPGCLPRTASSLDFDDPTESAELETHARLIIEAEEHNRRSTPAAKQQRRAVQRPRKPSAAANKPKTDEQQRRIDEIVQSVTNQALNQTGSSGKYAPFVPGALAASTTAAAAQAPSTSTQQQPVDTIQDAQQQQQQQQQQQLLLNSAQSTTTDGNLVGLVLVHERSAVLGQPDMIHVYLLSDDHTPAAAAAAASSDEPVTTTIASPSSL